MTLNNFPATVSAWAGGLLRQMLRMLAGSRLARSQAPSGNEDETAQLRRAADQAEADGDCMGALLLLEQLHAILPERPLLLRLARCRLLNGQWQQAADAYADAASQSPSDLYNEGFALARTGDFAGCLRRWQGTGCAHPDFLAQSEQIRALLVNQLHNRLDEHALEDETEVRQMLDSLSLEHAPGGQDLLARCRRLLLARLWREGQMREIMAMADEIDFLQPAVLEIQAKAACQALATDSTDFSFAELRHFADSWPSLLFHPSAGPRSEEERMALLKFGASLVQRHAAGQSDGGDWLVRHWEENVALLGRIAKLSAVRTEHVPVLAPSLALRSGCAGRLLALIKSSRDEFVDSDEWLETGSVYSRAAEALLMVLENRHDNAVGELADLEDDAEDDPFAARGAARVRTACGLHWLRQGLHRKAEQVLTAGPAAWSDELERQLLAGLDREDAVDEIQFAALLGILSLLPSSEPPDRRGREFCSALTGQVVRLHGMQSVRPEILAAAMQKAVALNPDDELARKFLDEVAIDLEATRMHEAVDQGLLAKAAAIAAASRHPRVVEQFFDFAGQIARQIEREDFPNEEAAAFMLEELVDSIKRVDPKHELIKWAQRALDSLLLKLEAEG